MHMEFHCGKEIGIRKFIARQSADLEISIDIKTYAQ